MAGRVMAPTYWSAGTSKRRWPTPAIAVLAVLALAAGCANAAGSDPTDVAGSTPSPRSAPDGRAGSDPSPSPASDPGPVPAATEPPATTTSTTTATPSTTATTTPATIPVPTTASPTLPPPPPTRPPRPAPPKPGRAAPPASIALPGPAAVGGEGVWVPGPVVDGAPAIETTTIRTNASGSAQAAVAWIDTTAVKARLFPGTNQPGGGWTTPPMIGDDLRSSLLAAFNSGFLLAEAQGGFFLDGREAVPLVNGTAAIHIDTDGNLTIGQLGRDVSLSPGTAAIRQNLPLLVDGGVLAASADDRDIAVWGKTLGKIPFVWRSGLGQRDDGTLVYVGGPAMSARSLGHTLIAAGAIRALELDINPNWVTFNTYRFDPASGTTTGTKLMANMNRSADRYLAPDDRDFFALFARAPT